MALVKVEKLAEGMVLAEDVLDGKARLLLAKGQAIGDKQIRVLKMWGVFEVEVEGAGPAVEEDLPKADSEQMAVVSTQIKKTFGSVDIQHPTVKEVVRLSVHYRLNHFQPEQAPVVPMPPPAQRPERSADVAAKLERIDVKLPEVPSLVFELNEIIADPMSSAGAIGQVVNKSPSLTATLLRIVNSAFYGFRSKIDSISRAVTLIGSKEVSNLALGITIMETFRGIPKEIMEVASFLEHNLACGVVARILAAHGNIAHSEQLFVSGMLHDIGRLVLCNYFPEVFTHTLADATHEGRSLLKSEQAVLGCTHALLGKKLLNKWKLPLALENNVFYHHQPSSSPSPETAAIIQMADMIVHGMGVGTSGEQVVPGFDTKAWERLNLPSSALRSLIKQAEHQIETFRDLFRKG
ncbi:MAG: HDOD domain-containing protein [Desulfatitalea sp.]|nr:HDOD domain-containing protein [Desulfatitalea sp.]